MIGLRIKLILLLLLSTFGCNGEFITDNITDAKSKFGYYSKYKGHINEANLTTTDDLKYIAKEIQGVIDYANAISYNTVKSFTPDILSDNESILFYVDRRDNNTCEPLDDTNYREYRQFYKGKMSFNEAYVEYKNYCFLNSQSPVRKSTTTGRPLTRSVVDNATTIVYYMLFDNLTTTIVDDSNGFSGKYTLFGILDRERPFLGVDSKYRLGLDYTINGQENRFDINFDDKMKTRVLKYYSSKHGYVTVSLTSELTSKITNDSVITYKYSGGECKFWVREIDKPQEFQKYCPNRK